MADNELKDFSYPNIEPTDYIDESLGNILARDDASKHGFRRLSGFPTVTQNDVGMKIYIVGRGNFQLISADPEPQWKQLSEDGRNAAYVDWVIENYQPISKLLTSLARLTEAQQAIPFFNGPEDMQATPLTTYIRDLLAQTDDAGVRKVLNLGSVATLDVPIPGSAIEDGSITMDKVSVTFKQTLGWSTGDCKLTFKKTADNGWIMLNDGSIGSAASGATTRANEDTKDLFMLMWDNPYCEVQSFSGTSSTKTTAIQDWSSNKRLILPKILGRAIACAGSGAGLTTRGLGESLGRESFVLSTENMPAHNHGLCSFRSVIGSKNGVYNCLSVGNKGYNSMGFAFQRWENDEEKYTQGGGVTEEGNGTSVDNLQPTIFVNVMMKL